MATANDEKPKRRKKPGKPGPKPGAKAAREAAAAAAANGDTETPAKNSGKALTSSTFEYELFALVTITQSGEQGQVRARAEWVSGNICYHVAYTTKVGEFKEAWIDQDLLEPFTERRKRTSKKAV